MPEPATEPPFISTVDAARRVVATFLENLNQDQRGGGTTRRERLLHLLP
jgi:hypothetical protein